MLLALKPDDPYTCDFPSDPGNGYADDYGRPEDKDDGIYELPSN